MLLAVKSIGYFHEKAGRCQAIFLVVATVHQTGNDRSSLRYSFANFRARFTRVLCRPLPSRESRFVNKRLTAKEDPGPEDFVRTRARLQRGHNSVKDFRYWIFEAYINDTWKVNNRLTVNVGVRYTPTTGINEVKQPEQDLISAPYGSWVLVTRSNASNPSFKNWDPRLGLAWDVFGDHKTSVRASFGEFHSVIYSRDDNFWLEPPFLTDAQTPTSVSLTGAPAPLSFPTPYTNLPVNAATVNNIPLNGSLSCTNCNYYGVHSTPHQIHWNFNFEREVMANTVAELGYVGSHGIDLWAAEGLQLPRSFHRSFRPADFWRL